MDTQELTDESQELSAEALELHAAAEGVQAAIEALLFVASESLDAKRCSDTPVARDYELGKQIGLEGTPGIVAANGTLIGGYMPPDELVVSVPVVVTLPAPVSESAPLAVRPTLPAPAATVPVTATAPVLLTLTLPPPASLMPLMVNTDETLLAEGNGLMVRLLPGQP